MNLLIQQGQLIDPSRTYAGIYDILIENETIAKIAPHITPPEDCICMDAAGLCVAPGLIDPHVHLQDMRKAPASYTEVGAILCSLCSIAATLCAKKVVQFYKHPLKANDA